MLDNDPTSTENDAATGTAGAPPTETPAPPAETSDGTPSASEPGSAPQPDDGAPVKKAAKKSSKAPAKKAAAKKSTAKKAAPKDDHADVAVDAPASTEAEGEGKKPQKKAAPRKRAAAKRSAAEPGGETAGDSPSEAPEEGGDSSAQAPVAPMVLFKAPEPTTPPARKRATKKASAPKTDPATEISVGEAAEPPADRSEDDAPVAEERGGQDKGGQGKGGQGKGGQRGRAGNRGQDTPESGTDDQDDSEDGTDAEGGARRRRRRGGRRRRKPSDGDGGDNAENRDDQSDDQDESDDSGGDAEGENGGSRRRRRRRRPGEDGDGSGDPDNTVSRVRKQRNPEDEITSIGGSTRLEAKKQRRREGREAGRRRAPIVSEAEFLARRESVDRVMVIRQKDDLTQIGVLEDKVLVEHYVARESQTSLIGNVYLGRVQNVLPSMEAAFIDIGKGRNAVLYAGEVNWAAVGHKDGQQRKIESVLSSGQTILVQVSKDPVGHKGARLTGQVSLPGRFLVYVPDGNTSGISRKLPDTERNRLKTLLKQIVPDTAGVIVRTAAEGASEDELTLDVERLTARWADIEEKVKTGKSPQMLYGEPDLTLKVVRDLFTEDFGKLVVQGDDAWDLVENYVSHVAPDLKDRLERFEPGENGGSQDLFAAYRVDEQIAKGLDRKVWLPSGGSLVIDRTEAMTVVDVNTGKFTGSGGNLEETVTKNNLEAAEEMVRQLRLRDIGGIIVIDFIDMVLESNRDLVLRRLVECLGRDRTRHQVAEVTSLGLVQMTRKRIGTGLLEAFGTDCDACKGRGIVLHDHPVESGPKAEDDDSRGRGRGRGGRNRGRGAGNDSTGGNGGNGSGGGATAKPSPADLAKSRPPEKPSDEHDDDQTSEQTGVGRPSGSAPEPQHVPSETPEPTVQGQDQSPTKSPTTSSTDRSSDSQVEHPESPTESPAETPAESPAQAPVEAPRAVTTTRRRTARRAAGPPSGLGEGTSAGGAGKQSPPSAEPVDIPVEPASPGHEPESGPERREQAVDPMSTPDPVAGPDPHVEDGSDAKAQGDPTWPAVATTGPEGTERDVEPEEGDDDSGNGLSLLHVPVKRKGSRKR